jgi:predicted regulator of Ras-like GTPase activity (Roadblock/LC7/MglB family)
MESGTTNAPSGEAAEQSLAYLAEMSPDVRGGAILAADGSTLAATGEGDRWGEASAALLGAADRGGDEAVEQVHVATEQGEVFAVRSGGLTAIAVTERFVLASLMAFDLRAVLRDLTTAAPPAAGGAS